MAACCAREEGLLLCDRVHGSDRGVGGESREVAAGSRGGGLGGWDFYC